MASAMHKMAVYLGLVEDDHRYEDGYDSYEEEYQEYDESAEPEAVGDRLSARSARVEFTSEGQPSSGRGLTATGQAADRLYHGVSHAVAAQGAGRQHVVLLRQAARRAIRPARWG